MPTYTERLALPTKPGQFYDLTDRVEKIVKESGIISGTCLVFCPGSTAAILLNENDPTLLSDLCAVLERLAPEKGIWHHAENAHSHIRAGLLGADRTVPIRGGRLVLGQWQSILLYEGDTTERQREVVVAVIGESATE